jgi:nitrogen fixation NifU-like protein
MIYGPLVADHIGNPRNLGKLDDADGVGQVDDAASETYLTVYLKLAPGPDERPMIAEARFRALGCSGCIATGSIATELVRGRTPDEVLAVDGAAINRALEDGLPEEQRYCADLAAVALHRAIEATRS